MNPYKEFMDEDEAKKALDPNLLRVHVEPFRVVNIDFDKVKEVRFAPDGAGRRVIFHMSDGEEIAALDEADWIVRRLMKIRPTSPAIQFLTPTPGIGAIRSGLATLRFHLGWGERQIKAQVHALLGELESL